ncbi:glycogen/starch synthase [Shewanella sp. UCD-KL12]|uniref:glycogen synthase n=1 Tax=Shewanella sp. UCD-KL12 TaxID=1917163 RepID=UPI0009702AA2
MLAAENGAIAGAKVGGMADVIGELPKALFEQGVCLDLIMPSYGFLAGTVNATKIAEFELVFGGRTRGVELLCAPHPDVPQAVIYFIELVEESGDLQIYTQGDPSRPFAEDANKFALFCLCVATALKRQLLPMPELVHLHDWHMAMFAVLSRFDRAFSALKHLPCVYTIHNLAIQGTRPLRDESSSLAAWFPELLSQLPSEALNHIIDPRYPHCINPMRAGINISDRVHLVSPTYALEVLQASNHSAGFFGGEGLEWDLQRKQDAGNLFGILNACVYEDTPLVANHAREKGVVCNDEPSVRDNLRVNDATPFGLVKSQHKTSGGTKLAAQKEYSSEWGQLLSDMEQALITWQGDTQWVSSCDQIALTRIAKLWRRYSGLEGASETPSMLVTSVGRLTDQKVLILRQKVQPETGPSISVLESILQMLAAHYPDGLFILLGSGDKVIADEFRAVAARYSNFIFLNGYDETVSRGLYQQGELFLMPSSFEPCGISQMLAMRAGQLCLVHGVGGLKDTVIDNETGYQFVGHGLAEQASNLLARFGDALKAFNSEQWLTMQSLAGRQRFDWQASAVKYKQQLYQFE